MSNKLRSNFVAFSDLNFTYKQMIIFELLRHVPKGQWISNCLFGVIVSTKIATISALKSFVAYWGLPWDLASNIINKEAYRKPQKDIKTSGQKSLNIFVAILVETMTPKRHFEINWPLNPNKFVSITRIIFRRSRS